MQLRVTYLWRPLWASIAAGRNVKTKGRPGVYTALPWTHAKVQHAPPPMGFIYDKRHPWRLLCNISARRRIMLWCQGCADYITLLTLPANVAKAAGDSGFLLENTPTAGCPLDIVTRSGLSISTPTNCLCNQMHGRNIQRMARGGGEVS